jgi:Outer membrane lipoprotein-sorting protein
VTQKRAARVAGCLVLAAALAPLARAASLSEVVDCAVGNLSPTAHRSGVFVTRASANAPERTIEWEYWALQPDQGLRKVMIARKGAADGEVAAYLFQDGDAVGETWQYVKGQAKAERLRLTGEQARLFGTNFSLEDYARTARVVFPGQVRQLPEATLDGRAVYVVETRPAPASKSEYERLVTSIDKERCTVLRRESYDDQFEGGKRARKVYAVAPDGVAADGKFFTPVRTQLDDAKDGSETRIVVEKFDLPANLDPKSFTPEALVHTGQ